MLKPLRTLLAISLIATPALGAWPVQGAKAPAAAAADAYHAPYAGRPNHAHAAPTFHWGWFGAERYSPVTRRHSGYYGKPVSWSSNRW